MKKNQIYLLSIVVFFVAVTAIVYNYNQKQKQKEGTVYALLDRKGPAANSKEWLEVKKKADDLMKALAADPTDTKASLKLAALFIQEARETGNFVYYDMAAMHQLNGVLKAEPSNFNALVFKSLIQMSQHHFADGLVTAHQAQAINPYNAYVYGLLVDGNVEMGSYDSAVGYADKMVSVRPDLTSYSRVSYLREIYGDYPGSIKAMKMAVETGGAGDEHTEWTRMQLGNLYEKVGDFKKADTLYNYSLALRPAYPYALAGLARVAMANGDYKKAIAYYQQADSLINDNSLKEELVDIYRQTGDTKKADETANAVIADYSKDAQAGVSDENIGHYADKELAYAYLKVGNTDKALEHAMLEYNRRPENIDVNEAVAWVYYNKGDYVKALPYIKTALKTNSKNPTLLSRAGLIYYKSGDKATAKTLLQQATTTNAYIGYALRTETTAALKAI
ncbi:tetratricopeptide repeat protein [Parasediminibacterium sp. JCM 36343]|uniref:tetratricopeptide repeat protein n=1 Tax=Parasediminibacterium sp. JCM 36343 TaxID=3374279 RepID=UPI00397D085E